MATPPELNLASLLALPLSQRDQMPTCPAIYFALDGKNRVLYVGRASNLMERWKDHHRLDQLTRIHRRLAVQIVWLDCSGNAEHLGIWESHYITLYKPLLNNTPVPPKKITPAEIALQDTLNKISKYSIIFGLAPESTQHNLPTVNIRYFGNGRVPHTLRRIFKASNTKPTSLKWTEFIRRKWAPWWRTRCNGIAIEVAPWSQFSEENKHFWEDLTVQSLAGIEMAALQAYQMAELVEKYPFLDENYPGITALEADPIGLIWTRTNQAIKLQGPKPLPLESLSIPEKVTMQSNSAQRDDLDELTFRKMNRQFLSIEGVEVEICTDCSTNKHFVRHNLFWKILFNKMNPDLGRDNVIENLKIYTNIRLSTIRWTGYDFKVERVYFIEDEMEIDAVLLPLAMFEDLIRHEYHKRTSNGPSEDGCTKLGSWLEKNTISHELNQPG